MLLTKVLVHLTLLVIEHCDHSFFLLQPLGDLRVKNEALLEVRGVLVTPPVHNHML